MAFAAAVVAGMAVMLRAVVDHGEAGRSEGGAQPFLYLAGDRAGYGLGHVRLYRAIGLGKAVGFGEHGQEVSRTGRGAGAALRRSGLRRAGRVPRARESRARLRRAGRLALAVPRPCPRVQRPLQLFHRDEPRARSARRKTPMAAGSARPAPSAPPAAPRRRAGPISSTRSTRSARASGRGRSGRGNGRTAGR